MMKKTLAVCLSAVLMIGAFLALPISASAAGAGSAAGVVSTSSGTLTVRSSASTTSVPLTSLAKGSTVTLLSLNGSWWQVEYAAGRTGYCSASYIQKVSGSYAAYVNTVSGSLNIRSGAGTTYSAIGYLAKGTGVVVLSQSGSWSRILYSGIKTGYVGSAYLKTYTSSSAATYPAIHLSVPSYKQTDSRWSSYPIGTTGKTIGTIGCLTTGIAMTESYRTGTTIYPNTMVSRLTYSADGTLYWPSNYVFDANTSYMQNVYAKLKAGKPVLFAAKNAYGTQHWVVVTGYNGGDTLSAANFTINDPGSSTKTTLQQHLASYPTFYKIAYYTN